MIRCRCRPMEPGDVAEVAALQAAAFPPPFPPELLWQTEHLLRHIELFPQGQFVVLVEGAKIAASCSNTLISEERWQAHGSWHDTVGGPFLDTFDPQGNTMYGLDITVHPDYRRQGLGRSLYDARFEAVKELGLMRYGTACRIPGFCDYRERHGHANPREYAEAVALGEETDRTMTPLLRYGLAFLGVIENYMEDMESGNAAALLEANP